MAETVELPAPLERQESVPMEIMNKCAYGEPSTKTIMVMGAVAAVLASVTVYLQFFTGVGLKTKAPLTRISVSSFFDQILYVELVLRRQVFINLCLWVILGNIKP